MRRSYFSQPKSLNVGKGLSQKNSAPFVPVGDSEYRSSRSCPECGENMYVCYVGELALDHCAMCRSYWFDRSELMELCGTDQDVPGMPYRSRKSAYQCDGCKVPMREYVFINPHNLLVDHCDQCGSIYLEQGELNRAVELSQANE